MGTAVAVTAIALLAVIVVGAVMTAGPMILSAPEW